MGQKQDWAERGHQGSCSGPERARQPWGMPRRVLSMFSRICSWCCSSWRITDNFCIYPQESRAFCLSVVDKSERWLPSPWGLEKFSRPPGPSKKPCLTKPHQDSSCPDEGKSNARWWLWWGKWRPWVALGAGTVCSHYKGPPYHLQEISRSPLSGCVSSMRG